jgi:hypothetical protein
MVDFLDVAYRQQACEQGHKGVAAATATHEIAKLQAQYVHFLFCVATSIHDHNNIIMMPVW